MHSSCCKQACMEVSSGLLEPYSSQEQSDQHDAPCGARPQQTSCDRLDVKAGQISASRTCCHHIGKPHLIDGMSKEMCLLPSFPEITVNRSHQPWKTFPSNFAVHAWFIKCGGKTKARRLLSHSGHDEQHMKCSPDSVCKRNTR